ncbi:inositol monophosphatase family protein [Albidovulum sp.]|uniref:inositol monophosphatase family protein n=1 Tax=Albidovulum sp. TaxID=1872424 RepID=UPI0039B94852
MSLPALFIEPGRDWKARIAALDPATAARLAARARSAPLFAHAYAFHLNFRFGGMRPADLLAHAARHGLAGVQIHVEDGEGASLAAMTGPELTAFGAEARRLGLAVHVETSSTEPDDLARTVAIAHATGASAMRCYPRHAGRVSTVIARTIDNLRGLDALDPGRRLRFMLEQHEDLTSAELLRILEAVGNPRLGLLFDFGNMVNAGETPLAALGRQAQWVREVHVKDCLVLPDRGGWAHRACLSDEGHLPMRALLVELLLLGAEEPQVRAFGLEEEEDYFAPALRFRDEEADPHIPARSASFTDPGPGDLATRLQRETEAAERQLRVVRAMLDEIAAEAEKHQDSSMTSPQTLRCPADMVDLAQAMADRVRPVIRRHFRTRIAIDAKDDSSPVTIADREAEQVMREMIAATFPTHGIRGEEFGPHQPDAEWVWVLDPIDGTKSFVSGSLAFGTQIALLHRGLPVLGLIDQPITGERWLGRAGEPTLFNGAPVQSSATGLLAEAVVYTSAPDHFAAAERARYDGLVRQARFSRASHDCYAAGLLALGTVDLLLEGNVHDYDILPQLPIIQGAGGVVTDWEGRPLTDASRFETVLMAGNAGLHAAALAALRNG